MTFFPKLGLQCEGVVLDSQHFQEATVAGEEQIYAVKVGEVQRLT